MMNYCQCSNKTSCIKLTMTPLKTKRTIWCASSLFNKLEFLTIENSPSTRISNTSPTIHQPNTEDSKSLYGLSIQNTNWINITNMNTKSCYNTSTICTTILSVSVSLLNSYTAHPYKTPSPHSPDQGEKKGGQIKKELRCTQLHHLFHMSCRSYTRRDASESYHNQ